MDVLKPVYTKFYAQREPFSRALGYAYDALLHAGESFDAYTVWNSLSERVLQGIYMGEGLLLPHTRISGLSRPLMSFSVCPEGFSEVENHRSEEAFFMCVLLSPAESASAHTFAIASMAKRLLDPQWKSRALAVRSDEDILALF